MLVAGKRVVRVPVTTTVTGSGGPATDNSTQPSIALPSLKPATHPDARQFIDRRIGSGDSGKDAVRALKRKLSDVVFRAMTTDPDAPPEPTITHWPLDIGETGRGQCSSATSALWRTIRCLLPRWDLARRQMRHYSPGLAQRSTALDTRP